MRSLTTTVARLPLERVDAVLFDLDGVVTDTAAVHAAAWKCAFDEALRRWAQARHERFVPFDVGHDYRRWVDGRSRRDGARALLAARGIVLPEGDPEDPPGRATVCGVANRKDVELRRRLREGAVRTFPSTIAAVRRLRAVGRSTAVFSASRHCDELLAAAGVRGLFDAVVGGTEAAALGLPGKPDPAVLLEAARRLATPVARTAVVEDAIVGVEAARRGGFGFIVGVDRGGDGEALTAAGADLVVSDVEQLGLAGAP
ncbi:HAD family hydrolase [Patulibacter defluvii]|uniref:HAD family hydrolase n=1 Tax=Patulibacter defluvii TaxID=3095358 RepID=UPI002A7497A8|nr:HAD-IA family hydrolase [Patulibacter sp. DM4]